MVYPRPGAVEPGGFQGFDEARRIMWCHEARARVRERLELTVFIADTGVSAVHVDNTTRADRVLLTHLRDMMNSGQVRGILSGQDESGSTGAA
jgi:hypothetical protein